MPTLTFKVTPEQAREVRRAARLKKLTVSDYLRRAALDEKPAPAPREDKVHPISGLRFSGPSGAMVTDAEIHAALVDFP
jgi:hypothetical protein